MQASGSKIQTNIDILISDKVDSKPRLASGDKETDCIIMMRPICQEDITFIILLSPLDRWFRQKLNREISELNDNVSQWAQQMSAEHSTQMQN